MRRALVPLVAATGCNWFYGLEHTVPLDASDAPMNSRTQLVWAIATTDGAGSVDPEIKLEPIGGGSARPMPPTILIGAEGALQPATYDADGSFEIPYTLRDSPHRIQYTLPYEAVAHEVQWSITGAVLTIPRTTRLD